MVEDLFSELGIALSTIPIYSDNQGSIFIGLNPVQECCTKHIDIHYHYVRECLENGNIELSFIEGASNTADMFTKNLGRVKINWDLSFTHPKFCSALILSVDQM